MKRIAFFVEGQTEQIFVNRLIKEILGTQQINIIQKQFRGGVNIPKVEIVRNSSFSRNPKYEVLIFDCGSDNRVKSEILDNIETLRKNGYEMIIGLRDLYPLPIDDLEKLEKGLRFLPNKLKNDAQYFDVIIAVHEIEAWFLAETNHFRKIDKRLTGRFIKDKLGFDPYASDPQAREHPAKDLDNIYRLVGKSYTKKYNATTRVVNKLDFNNIRFNLRYDINPLDRLLKAIENFKGKK
ncbi:MAG: DUF4276 family protein [Dysgonomonas sp.]|jgi:hypothetical protein|uniref:DUF4276 family protein n=1 Tax=unclassified Dysgonomonas TaxID=2630389 RepID=UPI0025BF7892|nr:MULTISPECIES: DUF4276 family protein [unclassified Dysgonomonas]MDR1714453.1 DUF4276 family protein [Prevotella sp.]MDR2003007.1 DUF4276 family protein [Prevotella sp.]HMM03875.1 DUF4276 family protein [Dysgonomonas sp.]